MGSTGRRKCSKCGTTRPEASFVSARGHTCSVCRAATARKAHRKQRLAVYAITPAEYQALFEAQGGLCAGCGESRRYNLHVEHDHKREREVGAKRSIRGLACARCNSVLRKVRDNPVILESLAWYLREPPARKVLDE